MQVSALAVVGRDWEGLPRIDDWPRLDMGPLGGLAGALNMAERDGWHAVLSAPCDMPHLPASLAHALDPAPAIVAGHPIVGCWPASMAPMLRDWLVIQNDRSMAGWVRRSGARLVDLGVWPDINTPEMMRRLD